MAAPRVPLGWILAGAGCLAVGGTVGTLVVGGLVWYATTRGEGSGAPDPNRKPRANKFTGTVRDERGQPIRLPGANVRVMIEGVAERSAERVSYQPPVDRSGHFQTQLVAGNYHPPRAQVEIAFGGQRFILELHPVQPNLSDRPSRPGILQDFVWKLTGERARYAGAADPKNHTHWYGASVHVSRSLYRNDLKRPTPALAAGTRFVFTLTPQGPRVDGSPAAVVRFERTWTGSELDNGLLDDIPLAQYVLTGVQVGADGQRPLIFETSYAKFEPQAQIHFGANIGTPNVLLLSFDAQ